MGMDANGEAGGITFLVSTAAWGGIERWIVNLANEFARRGHTVDLVLVRGGVVPYPDELSPEVGVVDFSERWNGLTLCLMAAYFRRHASQRVLLSKYHDAILAHRAARLCRRKVDLYFTIHSTYRRSRKNRKRVRHLKSKFRGRRSLIAVSKGVANELTGYFGVDSRVVETVYNPILGPDVARRCSKDVPHVWLASEPRPESVIVGAGRLVGAKDFATLIRAVAALRETHPCRLLILGEGPLRGELESLVASLDLSGVVELPGWVEDPMPWMARADLFVLSSRNEGLGNVLVEAMATGVPVVSTDCPNGPREILREGNLGPLVDPGDVDGLAAAMKRTLEADVDSRQLRDGVLPFYTETVANAYLAIMDNAPHESTTIPHS